MPDHNFGITRRDFLGTSVAALGAATLPLGLGAQATAKYRRYNVMSEGGKKALRSYAKGVEAMLKLPAEDPHNWFRNAFVHLMDCPHGNWWFYVWHRGFLGYFEQTIRSLSGDDTFAFPYWDWTMLPQIPDSMFDGVLTPNDPAFEPYTRDLDVFTKFIKPALTSYWNGLSKAQLAQLTTRGYDSLDTMWKDVTGEMPGGVSEDRPFAPTCSSRYLTRDNPHLDGATTKNSDPEMVYGGLGATSFYNPVTYRSFTSSKTLSHHPKPTRDSFSVLEGMPHNKIHNYIGGVGNLGPGPFGVMTNNLSPIDPIFFLHHSNMDRLWDVWTRKQKSLDLPYLPSPTDAPVFSKEQFLFFVNAKGQYVGESLAGDYLDMDRWEYDYEPGFGEKLVHTPKGEQEASKRSKHLFLGTLKNNGASATVPNDVAKNQNADTIEPSMFVQVTIPRSAMTEGKREFDVIVGAPPNATDIGPDSPYFAGTISLFGGMHMKGMTGGDATFTIPVPRKISPMVTAPKGAAVGAAGSSSLSVRVVPSGGHGKAPAIREIVVAVR